MNPKFNFVNSIVYFPDGSKFNDNPGAGIYGENGSLRIVDLSNGIVCSYVCLVRINMKKNKIRKIL